MKFVFIPQKAKARIIARRFIGGSNRVGIHSRADPRGVLSPEDIGVFYGVNDQTLPLFRRLCKENRAVYLDNGWMVDQKIRTFRWSWNGLQAHYDTLDPDPAKLRRIGTFMGVDPIKPLHETNNILIVLQSEQYFQWFTPETSRRKWLSGVVAQARAAGFTPVIREKPSPKDPRRNTLDEVLSHMRAVVSYNSAVSVRAMCRGLPVIATGPSTLNAMFPREIPPIDELVTPTPKAVHGFLSRLVHGEFTVEDLLSGEIIKEIAHVNPDRRYGISP